MRKWILKCAVICYLLLISTIATAKLVFNSKVDGIAGIYVMDDNGGNITLLTDVSYPVLPRWSPDGKQIVYTEYHFSIKQIGNSIHQIPKGFFYTICNRTGQTVKRLKIPKNL